MGKNIIIYTINPYNFQCGGLVVQYELCKLLGEAGQNVRIISPSNCNNSICNKFYNNDFPIDENTVVIYGETIQGNPLKAKNVVRWILAEIGIIADINTCKTWGKNDLVYYFNSELKFEKNPKKRQYL